jgi:hypothetical protein
MVHSTYALGWFLNRKEGSPPLVSDYSSNPRPHLKHHLVTLSLCKRFDILLHTFNLGLLCNKAWAKNNNKFNLIFVLRKHYSRFTNVLKLVMITKPGCSVIKGTVHVTRFSTLGFFHQTIPPGPLIHGLTPFGILLRYRRDMIDFRTQKSCKNCLFGSPFGCGGVGQYGSIYMFLIDIPFKGCQGRSNRSSIVHAVSMTPHAFQKIKYLREFEFIF